MLQHQPYTSIREWAHDDRPREKLIDKGPVALSNTELIAILLGTGTKSTSAVDLAKRALRECGDNLLELSRKNVQDLMTIPGIGQAKAVTIVAALELGRRRRESAALQRSVVSSSFQAYELISPDLSDLSVEEFWVLMLNSANKLIAKKRVSRGGLTATVVDPRLVFRAALEAQATSIILCHNHPSGKLRPSQEDLRLTKKLVESGKNLDLPVLDHVIIGENDYYSFADEGLI